MHVSSTVLDMVTPTSKPAVLDRPTQGAHLMVCSRSWHLPGNPKLVATLLALLKKGMCGSVYGYPALKISLGFFWI